MLLESPARPEDVDGAPPPSPPRWRWRRGFFEAVALFVIYQAFEWLRGQVAGSPGPALRHAHDVIGAERRLGLFHERALQRVFLPHHFIVELWDLYYGTMHFVVPVVALFALWRWAPRHYRHHLHALAAATLLGLVFFKLYPLAPPRLLPAHYGFVDTAGRIGGMGVFDSGSMRDTGNQFAAMPSLHLAWSTWCAIVLVPLVRARWLKALAVAYPVVTLAAVVITANHYFLDAVGGWLVLGAGWWIATQVERARTKVVALSR